MDIIGGLQNTKGVEDFALTPFIFLVRMKALKAYGMGIQWGYWGAFIGVSFNWPLREKRFRILKATT